MIIKLRLIIIVIKLIDLKCFLIKQIIKIETRIITITAIIRWLIK
jgi:hypothetical protein